MSFIEDFIITFFQEIVPDIFIYIGAGLKWVFLRKKYTFKEILDQDWNGRIGVLFVILISVTLYFFKH